MLILLIAVSYPFLSFNASEESNIKYAKIQFEGFYTESFTRIDCDMFDESFRKTKKNKVLTNRKDLKKLDSLMHCFAKEKHKEIDVRGKITIYYKGEQKTYCFDTIGFFNKDGATFYNKDLLVYISDKVYGYHPEDLN